MRFNQKGLLVAIYHSIGRNYKGVLLAFVLLTSACGGWDVANERICPDGKRAYFGVCPTALPPPPDVNQTRPEITTPETPQEPEAFGIEMVSLPGGCYQMGSPEGEVGLPDYPGRLDRRDGWDQPRHQVCVEAFAIGKYEVTKGQFAAFVAETGYDLGNSCGAYGEDNEGRNWAHPGYRQDNKHPVVCVSVEDINTYIRWLNDKTGQRYRLPTEAEWEYAARAGTVSSRYWGDDGDDACRYENIQDLTVKRSNPKFTTCNCTDGYVHTAPVGLFQPNNFGLYDMLGNVREVTCSKYDDKRPHDKDLEKSCANDAISERVIRGGSWYHQYSRSASRYYTSFTFRDDEAGFRLAQDR